MSHNQGLCHFDVLDSQTINLFHCTNKIQIKTILAWRGLVVESMYHPYPVANHLKYNHILLFKYQVTQRIIDILPFLTSSHPKYNTYSSFLDFKSPKVQFKFSIFRYKVTQSTIQILPVKCIFSKHSFKAQGSNYRR